MVAVSTLSEFLNRVQTDRMNLASNPDIELVNFDISIPHSILIVKDPHFLYRKIPSKTEIWGLIWPASIIASRILAKVPSTISMVEVGCGSGLVSSVASKIGFQVVGLDYVAEAVELSNLNIKNGLAEQFNWTRPIPEHLRSKFNLLVGADIVYLQRAYPDIVKCFQMLQEDGCALIVEADRPTQDFIEYVQQTGYKSHVFKFQNVSTEVGMVKNLTILVIYKHESDYASLLLQFLNKIDSL